MSAYTWGLLALALVSYFLGVVRIDRAPAKLLARIGAFPLTRRCAIEERERESFNSNARRALRVRLVRQGEREGQLLAACPLDQVPRRLFESHPIASPFAPHVPEWQLHAGDVVLVELAGFDEVQAPALLGRLRAIGGAA